ncbi:MAG: hypothetical protein ACPHSF_07580, partial [Flavobacteriales bacterium]
RFEHEQKDKLKRLGNVKFVGELLKAQLLSSKVAKMLITDLLGRQTEGSLEAVCAFFESIGQKFEQSDSLGALFPTWFSKLAFLSDDKTAVPSFRVRALIKDLLDLKKRNWVKNTTVIGGVTPVNLCKPPNSEINPT